MNYVRNGFQYRRHLWKDGWDLGCDYPGKTSYLGRLLGVVMLWKVPCFMVRHGWDVRYAAFVWNANHWHDWDNYAPKGSK